MSPRYEPSWASNHRERFIGLAGELDVWLDDKSPSFVFVVAPPHRLIRGKGNEPAVFNFDGHEIANNGVLWELTDVHLELHEQCLILQMLIEEGKINAAA